jgi:exonuclease SbcC
VIAGATDSGKTALVRGLRLVLYNVPNGTDYIRVGRNQATVGVEMGDGVKVVRERSRGSVNRYRIVKPGQTDGGQKLEGFGGSGNVPQEVVDVTGVRLVKVGERDVALNLSEQLDGPFLGSSVSSPERARILGKLAGTEEVDEAQKALNADIYHANQDEKRLAEEVEGLEARIGEYAWLEPFKENLDIAQAILTRVKEAEARRDNLADIRTRLNDLAARELEARKILNKWANLDRLELLVITKLEPAVNRAQRLRKAKAAIEKAARDTALWQQIADRWAHVEEAATIHARIEGDARRAANLREAQKGLALTSEAIRRAEAVNEKWQGVEPAAVIVASLDSGIRRTTNLRNTRRALGDNITSQTTHQATLGRWANVEKAAGLMARVSESRDQAARLRQIKSALYENAGRQNDQESVVAKYAGVEGAAEIAVRIELSIRKSTALRGLRSRLTANLEAQVVGEENLRRQSQALGDAEKAYADKLVALGTCPFCGSTVDPQLVKEVAS